MKRKLRNIGRPKAAARYCVVTISCSANPSYIWRQLVEGLVEQRLVAVVQQSDIFSTYTWNGTTCREPEILLTCKTRFDKIDALIEYVQTHHLFAVPEIAVTALETSTPAYLAWIDSCVS